MRDVLDLCSRMGGAEGCIKAVLHRANLADEDRITLEHAVQLLSEPFKSARPTPDRGE